MTTSELIELLAASRSLTDTARYNLIVADLDAAGADISSADSQALLRFFHYKITAILLPALDKVQGRAKPKNANL